MRTRGYMIRYGILAGATIAVGAAVCFFAGWAFGAGLL